MYVSLFVREFYCHCHEKPLRTKTRLRTLPMILDQQDWVEGTTASRVERSNLALLHPHGWRRLPRRKAGCIASAIDNLLATKEVDAVNVCPGTMALSRAMRLFILLTLSLSFHLPLLWTGPAARQVELSAGAHVRGCASADALLQTWQWDVKLDFTTIITLLRKKATSHSERTPGCSASPRLLGTGVSKHLPDGSMELSSVSRSCRCRKYCKV